MEVGTTTNNNLTARLPLLNPGDYDLWLIRIEQYFLMTDYSLWEERRNEMKARATLLMALPKKDQLKFHTYQDEKLLMEAIKKRFGGNKESKKVQRTLLKQRYENFAALSSESIDQTFDRLQKLIGQLEIQGEVINQEDMNLKLLRSLLSEWKYHALIWRNKAKIETISLDDLYNNLKIYEPELTGSSSTRQNTQNVAFVSNNTNNTNSNHKADGSSHEISTTQSTTHTHHNGSKSVCLDNLCDAVIYDLEEMDLQWEMAMLTIRARRFIKRTRKKLNIDGQRVGFDKSKVECFNCHKHGHFAKECRFLRNQEFKGRENNTRTITVETPTQNALIAQDGIGGYDWSYQAEEEQPTNHPLEALLSGSDKAYHTVPPPLTGNFIPRKPDLTFIDEIVKSENLDVTTVVTPSNVKTVEDRDISNTVESNAVRMDNTSALIIEDWNSDDESKIDYTIEPSIEKTKSVKTVRETDAAKQNPRGNPRFGTSLCHKD
ncbi:ribonuclease H-like domain-containing protein [Tanacetum coccineum]